MCIDIPRIDYKSTKKTEPGKVTKKAIDETIRIWNERKKIEAEELKRTEKPK